jgi:hypothetical protein
MNRTTSRVMTMRHIGQRAVLAIVVAASLGSLIGPLSSGPEPHHPEWAIVTKELEGSDWPLVTAARYDAVNHFILVDVRPGMSADVALRWACERLWPRLERVDSTVRFALYEAPDRVVAHADECALGT